MFWRKKEKDEEAGPGVSELSAGEGDANRAPKEEIVGAAPESGAGEPVPESGTEKPEPAGGGTETGTETGGGETGEDERRKLEEQLDVGVPPLFAKRLDLLKEYTVLGIDKEDGVYRGIPLKDRINIFIIGTTGVGKTTMLEYLIEQDLRAGRGFTLIDAHGDIVDKILSRIPPSRVNDVVYISPLTAREYGRVVKFNFLEPMEGVGTDLVNRAFIDSLKKIHKEFWGPRLEMILMNALSALREAMPGRVTVFELSRFLSNPDFQREVLKNVYNKEVRDFWMFDYKKMPPDAAIAVQTKISKILQESIIAPMFDTLRSTVNFRKLMDEKKIIIINLPEGMLTSDITNFLGSILLGRIYLSGMSREDRPEEERVPHYIYIDESSRFMSSVLAEILQSLRKYRLYTTLSAQDISQYDVDQYDRGLRNIIPSLCSTVCVFSCGMETARLMEGHFRTDDFTYVNLMNVPFYRFYMKTYYEGEVHRNLLDTFVLPRGPMNPGDIIRRSLELYGEEVSRREEEFMISEVSKPPFEPVIMFILQTLWQKGEMGENELIDELVAAYGIPVSAAKYGLKQCVNRYLVESVARFYDSLRRPTKRPFYYFSLTSAGVHTIYPPLRGPRTGDASVHIPLIARSMHMCFRRMEVPIQTTGQMYRGPKVTVTYRGAVEEYPIDSLPDIIVWVPVKTVDEKGKVIYDPYQWDRDCVYFIEAETTPDRNPKRVLAHFERAKAVGAPVVFAVSSEKDRDYVRELLREAGANLVDDVTDNLKAGTASVIIPQDPGPDENYHRQLKEALDAIARAEGKEPAHEKARIEAEVPPKVEERAEEEPSAETGKEEERRAIKTLLLDALTKKHMFIVEKHKPVDLLYVGRYDEDGTLIKKFVGYHDDSLRELLRETGISDDMLLSLESVPARKPEPAPKAVEEVKPEAVEPEIVETETAKPEAEPEAVKAETGTEEPARSHRGRKPLDEKERLRRLEKCMEEGGWTIEFADGRVLGYKWDDRRSERIRVHLGKDDEWIRQQINKKKDALKKAGVEIRGI